MKNERVIEILAGVRKHVNQLINEYQITHQEYQAFVDWMHRVGVSGEVPLFIDVFFESTVLKSNYDNSPGTAPNVLGPFYLDNHPFLEEKPYVLPQREDEKGDVLFFSGTVRDLDGRPLTNTLVDIWQSDADGEYSHFYEGVPEHNLRGKFYTDENGYFEVRTTLPVPYPIPTNGPTGELLKWIGQHPFRPAHIHFKISAENYEELITQIYFEGDPWLEDDVTDSVITSLIINPEKHDNPQEILQKGLTKPFFTISRDFILRQQRQNMKMKKEEITG